MRFGIEANEDAVRLTMQYWHDSVVTNAMKSAIIMNWDAPQWTYYSERGYRISGTAWFMSSVSTPGSFVADISLYVMRLHENGNVEVAKMFHPVATAMGSDWDLAIKETRTELVRRLNALIENMSNVCTELENDYAATAVAA